MTEAIEVQPLASVPVTVYVPATRPVAVLDVCPFDHTKLTVPVPPVEDAVAIPVESPKQEMLVCEATYVTKAVGWVTGKFLLVVQPLASVTVHVQVPGVKPVTEAEPSPVGLPGVQLYE